MSSEPMSEERLAEIRHRLSVTDYGRYASNVSLEGQQLARLYHQDVSLLLAEVERLRDQVDTLADEYDLLMEVERLRAENGARESLDIWPLSWLWR